MIDAALARRRVAQPALLRTKLGEDGLERIQALEIELAKMPGRMRCSYGPAERLSRRKEICSLREIHHTVKNNLQVISSLISLQARVTTHLDMQSVFDELQDRVRAIAALHENLYSSPDLRNILFGSYMEQLLRELFAFHSSESHRISLAIETADVVVKAEQALPLGLIVNELVTNSLKHAFPNEDKGEIKVCLQYLPTGGAQTLDDAQCELSITDNGRGLALINDAHTMGLRIVDLLVSELKGTFHIDRDRPHGAKFTVRFPLEPDE